MNKYIHWALVGYVIFVFIQSLFFKFSGSEETEIIFNTIADWMRGIGGLSALAPAFMQHGGYVIGGAELVASILLVVPKTRFWGALLGIGIISGAIFFHLFTPLGVVRTVDAAGNTDGGVLFMMACGVWISCAILLYWNRPGEARSA
jgi:cytochrome b subunit of formate dehydrogenase